ncbi:ABC transporter permease [Roseovarius aestuarii]|nr:ABC transporter permease [Roseovarius aestuarii]
MNLRRMPFTREIGWLVLAFLYLPVFILVLYSFNGNRTATVWTEFSVKWYARTFHNPSIQVAAWNSIILAITASFGSTVLALLAAMAARHFFKGRSAVEATLNAPLILPEIVIAVATLILVVSVGVELGLMSMIPAHVAFCIPFAYLPIRARIQGMDAGMEEAAMDLYCNRFSTFRRVTLPLLWPGVLAGFTLAFVTSLDLFLVSFFLAGPGSTTLPVYIYSAIKAGISPEINAISTIMLVVSIALVMVSFAFGRMRR